MAVLTTLRPRKYGHHFPDDIEPVQWLRHFRSLLQNHTPDGTYKLFSDYICASLSTLEGVSIANEELNKPTSLEELTGVIKDLKSGKASFFSRQYI